MGFDIGGTKCAVITATVKNGEIEINNKKVMPTDLSVSPYIMINRMIEAADGMTYGMKIDSVGVSCGGPLDSKKGIIMSPPNLKGWNNVCMVEIREKEYGVSGHLQNGGKGCAVAEWKFGAGKGTKNMVFLTFGTGLGAGMILDGKLYSGTNDNAGEVGHIRLDDDGPVGYGKAGSFEGFCSGGGIAQLGKIFADKAMENGITPSYVKDGDISSKTIAIAAENGDKTAIEVFKLCGEKLGRGLSVIIDILNPEKIIIGSIFARSRNLLWQYTKDVIDKEALSLAANVCEVVPASLGEQIGDYAAIGVALLED